MMKEVTGKLKGRLMRTNTKRHNITTRAIGPIDITTTSVDGFTIVEVVVNNKRYHGLAKQNDSADNWSEDAGIVIAGKRAFDLMVDDQFKPIIREIGLEFPLGGPSSKKQQDQYHAAIKIFLGSNPCAEIVKDEGPLPVGIALYDSIDKDRSNVICKLLL